MPQTLTAHYHFEGIGVRRHFCLVNVSGGQSLSHAIQFGEFLKQYSGAKLYHVSYAIGEPIDGDVIEPGKYAYIGRYARIYLRREEDGRRREVNIPAPLDSMFDENQEVPVYVGEQVAQAYELLTGEKVTFMHGGLISNE